MEGRKDESVGTCRDLRAGWAEPGACGGGGSFGGDPLRATLSTGSETVM